MFFDPRKLRRAQTDEVRKILFAAPKNAWTSPKRALEGVEFEIHSSLELDRLYSAFPAQFRDLGDVIPQRVDRHARVRSAGKYTRTDELPVGKAADGAAFALEHPELGAVYVDVRDKSYLHFSPSQLPQAGLPTALQKDAPTWKVSKGKDKLTVSTRGPVSLDVVIEYVTDGKVASGIAAGILSACLPGLDGLAELGLPFAQIAAGGMPKAVETWLVNAKGQRRERLARHRISGITVGPIDAALFGIPDGFRNLRDRKRGDAREWYPIGGPCRRTRRSKRARAGTASAARSAQARAAYSATRYQATIGQFVPPKIEVSTEPVFPECLPSTLQASSALEIRQTLLDAIQFLVNVMARRLDTAAGSRVVPGDPENTDVALTIDWLDQLERFHREQGDAGDGLFCLLRDPPPDDDPTGGGTGLLDRMAETLARELVAHSVPLPLGGEDDAVTLPQAIEDEIAALVADASIPTTGRFDALPAASQAAVREEVLAQRIATIDYLFDGDFGEQIWPHRNYDLVHIKLQLEQLALEFADGDAIRRLVIALEDNDSNQPGIEFELALARLDATLTMERWPGLWFWITAAGVLVTLSIVGSLAVTGLILTLIGLGPVGLLILMLLISQGPVATVAGGAVLLAAVTYLVWDVTALRLTLEQPVLRARIAPDNVHDPDEVVLDPDRVSLDGDIAVSVNSQIPSGIHQIFDAVVNSAITQFDTQVREELESVMLNGLRGAVRRLPHFRLPQPFDVEVPVAITGGGAFDHIEVDTPQHDLIDMSANGVAQWFLSAGAVTRMAFPFPGFAPHATQVDRDLRENLTARIEQINAEGDAPCLGYGISQNLLNGIVYAQWLAGRFVRDYDDDAVEVAFTTLIDACPACAQVTDSREVHVWAAAAPYVSVTPRAYLEEEAKPYLSVCFPDVRVCIGGVAGKVSTLELQCSIESVAHVALGGLGNGGVRTLFSLEGNFLNVLFDDRREFRRLSPWGMQGLEGRGPGFDSIAAMGDDERLQLLESLQPLLETAAARLLRRNNIDQISFVPETARVDQQIYDGVARADFQPRRASLYVVITTFGPISNAFPRFNEQGVRVREGIDFDGLDCAEGIDLRT